MVGKSIDWGDLDKLRHGGSLFGQKGETLVSAFIFGRLALDKGEWARYDGSPPYQKICAKRILNQAVVPIFRAGGYP